MPGHARSMVPGAAVRLLQRGNNRAGCFFSAGDRRFYLFHLNHVHLLVLYAQYVNKTYRRTGSPWEGWFKSCLVQSEGYLLACYRYIELNPVRAGLVTNAARYPWSSFRANAHDEECAYLVPHSQYLRLGKRLAERQAVYRDTFGSLAAAAQFDEIRQATTAGYVLGDAGFKRAMACLVGRRVEQGNPGRPSVRARQEANAELFPA